MPKPARGADVSGGGPDDWLWRWVTFSPALLMMLLLSLLPLVNLFLTSFYNVTWAGGLPTWTPVGVANYNELVHDELPVFVLDRHARAKSHPSIHDLRFDHVD